MPGAGPPRALAVADGIWAIVADAPLDRSSGERLEEELHDLEAVSRHALAHASMIEFFFRRSPVIPLKLFTLFSRDDRVRQNLVARASRIRALFGRLRGVEEWGVRITASAARAAVVDRPETGRGYLEVKKRMKDEDGAPSRAVKSEVSAALRRLALLAARTRKETFPPPAHGRPYVAGASYLVKATRRSVWKKSVAQTTSSLRKHGHRLEISGPWPPYHFASGA
jgi:hypothetical protein